VDVVDVVLPVHHSWVEAERSSVRRVESVPHLEEVRDLVDGFTLGVETVELDVFEGALDLGLSLLQPSRPQRLAAAKGECLQRLFGGGVDILKSRS
jgi:hypothetical protein